MTTNPKKENLSFNCATTTVNTICDEKNIIVATALGTSKDYYSKLFCASPDLLEACEKMHDFILSLPVLEFGILELQELSELAHKALSKAKGES